MAQAFPNLTQIVLQETIPLEQKSDELIWKHTSSGTLSFKHAFIFKSHCWLFSCPYIPSKSLLVWRLMHYKITVDDKLKEICNNLPLVCKLGISSYVIVELSGAMRAIKISRGKNWLETAFMMVLHAFKVLWEVRNGLRNFIVSHIYREGNRCVVFSFKQHCFL